MPTLEWLFLIVICLVAASVATYVLRRPSVILSVSDTGHSVPADPLALPAPTAENTVFSHAPIAIWTTDKSGAIGWTNDAYKSLSRWRGDTETSDPVFPTPDDEGADQSRFALYSQSSDGPEWYEVTRTQQGDTTICYAQNVTALVNMEESRRTFFQTMAGTFAQLSIGLAIFDKDRRMNLFNPALVDLCGLPFSFLSSRPDLASFFDQLRDSQSLPEPRDYSAWRSEMSDLAQAAAEGRYQETWTLPSGSVYQVTGRPHPGGAIAFLFEDISAEVSLARQFRTELALFRSVLDVSEQAMCVLSASDKLMFANAAYLNLWGQESDDDLRGLSLAELCENWGAATGQSFDAETLRQGIADGPNVAISSTLLPGGDLLIRLHDIAATSGAEQKTLIPV